MDPVTLDALTPSAASPSTSTTASTLDLVVRAGKGDTAAYETLIRERLDSLYRTAWAILGNEADAPTPPRTRACRRGATSGDCASRIGSMPGSPGSLSTAVGCGCALALGSVRSRWRPISIGPGRRRATRPVRADAIARAFDRLSADARTILVLHHLQHQPVNAIAAILGIPVGTVKSRLHTARSALAKALERERR